MNLNKTSLTIIILIAAVLIGATTAHILINYLYPGQFKIINPDVQVTLNGEIYPSGTLIDWGIVEQGTTYYMRMDINNTGDIPLQIFWKTTGLPGSCTCTWQHNSTLLQPAKNITGDLTLTINTSPFGQYNFDNHLVLEDIGG